MRKIRMSVLKKDGALKKAGDANQAIMREIANLETEVATIQAKGMKYLQKQVDKRASKEIQPPPGKPISEVEAAKQKKAEPQKKQEQSRAEVTRRNTEQNKLQPLPQAKSKAVIRQTEGLKAKKLEPGEPVKQDTEEEKKAQPAKVVKLGQAQPAEVVRLGQEQKMEEETKTDVTM